MIRILLYGDVDLNLIDGSAIWLASLAEVLGGIPEVDVTVLQKTRLTRDVVIRSAAALPNVRFLDPWTLSAGDPQASALLSRSPAGRLTPDTAAALIARLDQESPFDVLLVRSIEATAALAESPHLARRLWAYLTDPLRYTAPGESVKLRQIAERCGRVVCQTDEAKAALVAMMDGGVIEKVVVLPPMIPELAAGPRPPPDPAAPRLGYSGKFSPPYMIVEMLDAFEKIRRVLPGAEFHVVGDKFHNVPPVKDFVATVTRRLSTTPGVIWHGGVSRADANEILSRVHVASSWRASTFDDSVEFSTKILEYAALGIPVLMNPSSIQFRAFGPEYPAYVTTEAEFIDRFLTLAASPAIYSRVSQAVLATAAEFTFESNRRRLLPLLRQGISRPQVPLRRPTILWVGHDFKFLRPIKEAVELSAGYRSLVDEHEGHVIQQPTRSQELLTQADLIFCEWCLGNAEWYSKHKRPHQRLVVRLHRQEIELPFLHRICWEGVDRIIFITEWVMERFLEMFPFMKERAVVIYNAVDCRSLEIEKLPGAEFNLGLLGFCPKLKAPHLAFDILASLKQLDRRYTLFIKGKPPWELNWLWKRSEERRYYEDFFARINRSPYANSVVFDPHGDDVPTWLSKIGFILSTSDLEGSHQAVAEGMASGAIPVIRDWLGSERLYPRKYIFSSVAEAVDMVRTWNTVKHYDGQTEFCHEWARKFDLPAILPQYFDLVDEMAITSHRTNLPTFRSRDKALTATRS